MSFRNPSRKNSSNLSIKPPSPSAVPPPTISTPTNYYSNNPNSIASPRRAPLPPSPTNSIAPPGTAPWVEDRSRSNSLDVPRYNMGYDVGPPVPGKGGMGDKKLPVPPGSPHRKGGGFAGAYDNKLVSSTLSHLPPLPPLSPQPTGSSSLSPPLHHPRPGPGPPTKVSSTSYTTALSTTAARPSFSSPSSSSGIVVLPNGTALLTSIADHDRVTPDASIGVGRSLTETLAHSSPSSPWSLLTVHVLPLFAGGPLKTPIEDLNQLCHSHIIATSQRAQPARIVAVLSSDFREFVASGMLTLKAKFETLEEAKIVARAAEVWSFFWAQVLPYLEGVFLPLAQVRDLPSTSHASASSILSSSPPIPVRHLLLSGFLCHILLPLLPRLLPLISSTSTPAHIIPPTASDLQRILQMSLVLSTQARYSSFFPTNERADEEVRVNVDNLGKTIRWRMSRPPESELEDAQASPLRRSTSTANGAGAGAGENWVGNRKSLQRGPSMNNGRYRKRGWRASSNFGQTWGQPPNDQGLGAGPGGMNRQHSDSVGGQIPEQKWGRPRVDEEDEDDVTPGQSLAYPRNTVRDESGPAGQSMYASTANSTLTAASTIRAGDSMASTMTLDYQRTPQADYGRRVRRTESSGSSEVTPVAPDIRRR